MLSSHALSSRNSLHSDWIWLVYGGCTHATVWGDTGAWRRVSWSPPRAWQ